MSGKRFFKRPEFNKLYDYIIYKSLTDGTYDIIESNTKTVKNITYDEYKLYERKYEMSKYGKTDDLTEYLKVFHKCIEELRTNDGFKINWTFYFHNFLAIINTIKRLTKTKYGYLKCKTVFDSTKHEKITSNEFRYYQNTNNGGLLYTVPGTYNCYGYDYTAFYLNICIKSCEKNDDGTYSGFVIPTQQGKEIFLSTLPTKWQDIEYGIYKVSISSTHKDINKIFAFSKTGYYTHYSLQFAMQKQKQFDITIKLDTTIKYNALVYERTCLIPSFHQFRQYGKTLLKLRKKYPDNFLLKMLISQFAGTSAHKNVKKMSNEQIDYHNETQEKKIIFGKTHEIIEQEYKKLKTGEYVEKLLLLDMDKPYSMNIRLLPFLTSYGRIKTAKLAIKDLDNVIRINTDNVTFLKEQIFETNIKNKKKLYVKHIEGTKHNMLHLETLKPEEKTTGLIEFKKKGYKHIDKDIKEIEKEDNEEYED
jgi:hypothetical protein